MNEHMFATLHTVWLPLGTLAAGSLAGLIRGRRRRAVLPRPTPAEEALQLNLDAFMSALGSDLERLQAFAPRFAALFAEIGLTVLALEYALRDKLVLDHDEVRAALSKTLELARGRGALASTSPEGNA